MLQRELSPRIKHLFFFWFHLFFTVIAWVGPFLIWWPLMLIGYGWTVYQFWKYERCLMNGMHGLSEENNYTFYAYLFEMVGIPTNRPLIKKVVRGYLYIILGAFTFLWQVVLGYSVFFAPAL